MTVLGLSALVVVGFAVWVWWTRKDTTPRPPFN